MIKLTIIPLLSPVGFRCTNSYRKASELLLADTRTIAGYLYLVYR